MVDKLHDYQGCIGRLHAVKDNIRSNVQTWREQHPGGFKKWVAGWFYKEPSSIQENNLEGECFEDYSHIYRRKTRGELVRVSAAVMGIEFSYAAETAFVSPTLLQIGVEHKHMTLVWALSPLVGFFVTPLLGSLSDRCRLNLGRRRPFILLLSLGVFLGLMLVPNGESLGYYMGDTYPYSPNNDQLPTKTILPYQTTFSPQENRNTNSNWTDPYNSTEEREIHSSPHPWGVFFTVLGTVLLDFDADACQSPARAYLLDVTVTDDHAKGLSTFTIMAGLGGFMGYALGGINWDATFIGKLLGGHVRAVFTLITIIFVICVGLTLSSFKEIPLIVLENRGQVLSLPGSRKHSRAVRRNTLIGEHSGVLENINSPNVYGTSTEYTEIPTQNKIYNQINDEDNDIFDPSDLKNNFEIPEDIGEAITLKEYLKSIVIMPYSLKILCLTNLFCWMSHVCYSLYFTDFVGEAVFGGDPKAAEGSVTRQLYDEGIRFGCWGMSMYSLSCACYSLVIEKLIKRFGAKPVYVGGLCVYCVGMSMMALTRHPVGVIIFSWSAGVLYSTLFTMPYLLIAHYHALGTFELDKEGQPKMCGQIRGLGTDVAIVSSMVFLAQFTLSMCMGTIVTSWGTTTAVVVVASALSFCGALSATQVMYLDL